MTVILDQARQTTPNGQLAANIKSCYPLGWSFTPLNGKVPVFTDWVNRERPSQDDVLRWGSKGNIGLRTGRASGGIIVIDVDNGGDVTGLDLPETVTTKTGGGGKHFYFRYDGRLGNSAGKLGEKIDTRGDGGQVVFPGSIHPDTGQLYRWIRGRSPDEIELAELPESVVTKLRASKPRLPRQRLVNSIPEGERNTTLTSLAGVMRSRGMGEKAIEAALIAENQRVCQPPLPDDEVRRIAQSVARYEAGEEPATAVADVRLGDEFVAAHADCVRYCPDTESWLVWDGRRWEPDAVHKAERLSQEFARRRLGAAANISGDKVRESEVKFWMRAMNMTNIMRGLQAARSNPAIIVRLKELDANPWLLNCLNGTVDLGSAKGRQPVEVRAHNPADMISKLCPVEFDPATDQSGWLDFLERVLPDVEVRYFLMKAVGYSLTGMASEEVLFHISGPTASGKSTFISAIRGTLGDYAASANFETFLQQTNKGGPRSDLVRLAGKRFVASVETEEGSRLAGGLLKWITGQDALCVRGLYQSEVEFLPSFTLWLVANFLPRAADDDSALWRRLMLLPFDVTIPKADRDPEVKRRLSNPAIGGPAVLAWAVRGCAMWRREGLDPPKAVKAATRQWRAENDPLADWLTERVEFKPGATTPFADLQQDYRAWAESMSLRPISAKKLAMRLQQRGCGSELCGSGGRRHYTGVCLRE